MASFQPFPGLRYDTDIVPLGAAIAPPYDVVDDAERKVLAERSPYNAIHVELPVPETEVGLDRYEHAAAIFAAWEHEGAIRRDDVPSFYVYRMNFTTELGEARSTTGVIGALGIDKPGGDAVLPHERTMPKPKGDRLDLLHACRANLSPIWGLSLASGLAQACSEAVANLPAPASATDDEGITHELWPISDTAAIERITSLVGSTPVVIADGHHRYETALFYQQERYSEGIKPPAECDYVMALVVELAPEELFVQSIHRLLSDLPDGFDLLGALSAFFDVTAGPTDVDELVRSLVPAGALGLVTAAGNFLLVPHEALNAGAEADLDSSRLDVVLASLPAHELVYQHGARHAADAVAGGSAQAAFLLRPATVEQIADTAHSGRRMPPKTTFFQPKPRTGVVYRTVLD